MARGIGSGDKVGRGVGDRGEDRSLELGLDLAGLGADHSQRLKPHRPVDAQRGEGEERECQGMLFGDERPERANEKEGELMLRVLPVGAPPTEERTAAKVHGDDALGEPHIRDEQGNRGGCDRRCDAEATEGRARVRQSRARDHLVGEGRACRLHSDA